MLASGIKGIRVQLGIESDPSSTIFMRRRLGCPVCLQRGASPPFHSGLLRMADLVSMQPNLKLDLFIVAPDERREYVFSTHMYHGNLVAPI